MLRLGLLTLVVGLVGAQAAWAAPDRTIAIGGANPSLEFDGGPVNDFSAVSGNTKDYVDPGATWDETLIKVETAGRLAIKSTTDGLPTSEIDLTLVKSDAEGARGAQVAEGITDGPEEKIAATVKEGYYLLIATGWPAVAAAYKGELNLTVAAPPAPVAAPALPVPAAPARPAAAVKKKLTCGQKARRIKSARKRKAALRRCAKPRRKRSWRAH